MTERYGRDLDLNLLRVFTVVAETGSVTQAAAKLYMTQPAVSAALRRLVTAIGAPLFARRGRGLALTSRGEKLLAGLRPHLQSIVDAALAPVRFEARSSERTHRIGLSDTAERWLLPELVKVLGRDAPRMCLVSVPITFRNVGDSLGELRQPRRDPRGDPASGDGAGPRRRRHPADASGASDDRSSFSARRRNDGASMVRRARRRRRLALAP